MQKEQIIIGITIFINIVLGYAIYQQDRDMSSLQTDMIILQNEVGDTSKIDGLSTDLDNTLHGLVKMTNLLEEKFENINKQTMFLATEIDKDRTYNEEVFKVYDSNVKLYNTQIRELQDTYYNLIK